MNLENSHACVYTIITSHTYINSMCTGIAKAKKLATTGWLHTDPYGSSISSCWVQFCHYSVICCQSGLLVILAGALPKKPSGGIDSKFSKISHWSHCVFSKLTLAILLAWVMPKELCVSDWSSRTTASLISKRHVSVWKILKLVLISTCTERFARLAYKEDIQ